MFHAPRRLAAAVLIAAAATVQADPVATLEGRESVTHVHYYGGFAIAGSQGDDGSLVPVTTLAPATLDLANVHQYSGAYLYWTVDYTMQWSLSQGYAVDPLQHTLSAWGDIDLHTTGAVVGPNCAPCLPTMQVDGNNHQALDFRLSEATAYSFHSLTTPGQWIDLLVWNPLANRWDGVWLGAGLNQGTSWDKAGTLQAGLYRLRNNPYGVRVNGATPTLDQAWDWTLTLPGAEVVAPVPEPASALMLVAGGLLLAWRRRPRP